MSVPNRSDLALMLVFCVGLPLTAGGWWRYLSGYEHPQQGSVIEQVVSAEAEAAAPPEAPAVENQRTPLLARTSSTALQGMAATHVDGGIQADSLSGEEEER